MQFRPEQEITLAELRPGESTVLLSVGGEREEKLRLLTLGLTPGQRVTLLMKDPTGRISVFAFRGITLAMTGESALSIKCKRLK